MQSKIIVFILLCMLCTAGLFAKNVVILSNPPVADGITKGEFMDWSCYDGFKPFDPSTDEIDTLWWTGVLDHHIFGGQSISWNPDLPVMDGVWLQIKYGLWNSPSVHFYVTVNGSDVGNFWANWGYITPGPKFIKVNISDYVIAGPDLIEIVAQAGGGEAVIGYVGAGTRVLDGTAGVNIENPLQLTEYKLHYPAPNPFNPSTTISYQISADNYVNLTIYDIAGREVSKLVDGHRDAGSHEIVFNAGDLVSGVYFVKLEAGEYTQVQKMILMK